MNLGSLKTLARAYVPTAKRSKISESSLELILNQGKNDLCAKLLCLPKDETFNVVADTRTYDLSSVLTRYIAPAPSGLWWYNSEWTRLNPRTRKWWDIHKPDYLNSSSADPLDYIIENDNLIVEPPPATALTNGFKMFFYQKSPDMTDDSHFPFGEAVEISRLAILSESILLYWKWKAFKIIGKKEDVVALASQEYKAEWQEKKLLLARRPDISKDKNARYQGVKVC